MKFEVEDVNGLIKKLKDAGWDSQGAEAMTNNKPITDVELAEVEAMARTLGDVGFPLKSEMLGLIERLRLATQVVTSARILLDNLAKTEVTYALRDAIAEYDRVCGEGEAS